MYKQSGNAASITIVILLVIIIAGGLGYLFYKNANPDAQTESQQPAVAQEEAEPAVASQDGYLSVEEWGVKIRTSNANKLLYSPFEQVGGAQNVEQGVLGLLRKPGEVRDPACRELGIEVYRQKVEPEFNSKKIGDYYYYVTGSPSECSDNPLENATHAAILDEIKVDNISAL